MCIEEAIVTYLLTKANLTSLVSNKIYPLTIPQGVESPSIVYQKISTDFEHSFGGDTGFGNVNIQFDIYAKKYSDVKTIEKQLRLCLQNYRGLMGTLNIQSVLIINARDIYEEETKENRVMMEFEIYYTESEVD